MVNLNGCLGTNGNTRFWEDDPWRVLRIMSEFVDSFEEMSQVPPGISIFGSARTPESDPSYTAAVTMGRKLAKLGFSVITGGGPGIMEAANRGAAEIDRALSIGLNIKLPQEQAPNPYAGVQVDFRYFFARKVCLAKYSMGFVFFPGGFGTLDEFAELVTLVQTERIPKYPMILFGKHHWEGFCSWVDQILLQDKMISPGDNQLYRITDDVDEAVELFSDFRRSAGTPRRAPRAFR
ncbi:MAG: TIGR00730 family Rossman fold protein [Verrucomicrobiales bacterium]|nr:TIGR00730 family Rossman fold protein [Verrucomicrobiales bacterium]